MNDMKFCINCGEKISKSAHFCEKCGSVQPAEDKIESKNSETKKPEVEKDHTTEQEVEKPENKPHKSKRKRKIVVWSVLGILIAVICLWVFSMFPGITVRDDAVAEKQASKMSDSVFNYLWDAKSGEFENIDAMNSDGVIVITVSLADKKYVKNSLINRIELTKVSYDLWLVQKRNNIKGTIQVIYTVDGVVVDESDNLLRPVKYVSSNDDTYDTL